VKGHVASGGLTAEQLEAAELDLARIREYVDGVARGDLDAAELTEAMRGYLARHGPALRGAAAGVGEAVRRQLLEQLYSWRDQLDDQVAGHPAPPSETSRGHAAPARGSEQP
jgi:hypothetical protein